MKIRSIARWHPFLILGVVSYTVVIIPSLMGWDYDAHPLATVFFVLSQLLGIVFHLIGTVLAELNGGRQLPYQTLLVTIVGLAVYLAADIAFSRYAVRRGD